MNLCLVPQNIDYFSLTSSLLHTVNQPNETDGLQNYFDLTCTDSKCTMSHSGDSPARENAATCMKNSARFVYATSWVLAR